MICGAHPYSWKHPYLGGGFKYFLFSPLLGEDEPILANIFQMGWNHQPAYIDDMGIENPLLIRIRSP